MFALQPLVQPEFHPLGLLDALANGTFIVCDDVHQSNTLYPMVVTLPRIVIVVILLQLEKALLPILVTLLGIVIVVNPVQPSNA